MLVSLCLLRDLDEHYEFVLSVCEEHDDPVMMYDDVKPPLCSRMNIKKRIPWKCHVIEKRGCVFACACVFDNCS